MSISAIGSAGSTPIQAPTSQKAGGTDQDHDSDGSGASAATVKAAPAAGTGKVVDKTA